MKFITIMGSPKKNGKTDFTLSLFEDKMRKAGHEIERINAIDININGCKECYACTHKSSEHGCPQKDDWDMVFKKMLAADALIYATPLFCYGMSAQLKPLTDRHFSLMNKDLLKGKLSALLVTSGGEEANNTDLLQTMFRRAFDINEGDKFKTTVVGNYVAEWSIKPDFEKRAEAVAEKMFNDFNCAILSK
ncbi:MAG: flavodoxin family protein [Clostridium beijerinckii]|jgi:multimeric flavodoxin WrbA|nr:flavodoxin family protein [Clostridium beijerinckii]MCI1584779.1 flavodoxin family protein [Clostridium beijerinckii]MCI1624481.1 flavodoxin family protein [Clostridium beijerinckii]